MSISISRKPNKMAIYIYISEIIIKEYDFVKVCPIEKKCPTFEIEDVMSRYLSPKIDIKNI
jgi:hypothetical protein